MSRPKPEVLLEAVDTKTMRAEQILAAEAVFSVFYAGRPINIRSLNKLVAYPGPKYRKVSFSNPAHAINLAQRLNSEFKTNQFTVMRFDGGCGDQYFP